MIVGSQWFPPIGYHVKLLQLRWSLQCLEQSSILSIALRSAQTSNPHPSISAPSSPIYCHPDGQLLFLHMICENSPFVPSTF